MIKPPDYDLTIIGGGINGAGIARDAAGRGLRVLLIEQDDLGAHTSSASTKLIHGGLRYLEQFEFMLVRKALQEREVILRNAPHIARPLRFVMPHQASMRPAWMIRAGMFLYDHLASREQLPASEIVELTHHSSGAALKAGFNAGFVYSDGWVDDARLVLLNALDAKERSATICPYTACVRGQRHDTHWTLELHERGSPPQNLRTVTTQVLVNATGPWVGKLLQDQLHVASQHHIRLVKGSHIVVPKLFNHGYAYIFQGADKRIIFAIPYEHKFTLIGTTEDDYTGDPANVSANTQEIDYLCQMVNQYFHQQIAPQDVVHSYAGVRPLLGDNGKATHASRDYTLELNLDGAPLLSVFGGKITTFRKLAEQALEKLSPLFEMRDFPWTQNAPLPGGDILGANFEIFLFNLTRRTPWLNARLRQRLAHAYGSRVYALLDTSHDASQMGEQIATDVYTCELQYSRDVEFTRCGHDFLWRRSKLGLHLSPAEITAVKQWFIDHPGKP